MARPRLQDAGSDCSTSDIGVRVIVVQIKKIVSSHVTSFWNNNFLFARRAGSQGWISSAGSGTISFYGRQNFCFQCSQTCDTMRWLTMNLSNWFQSKENVVFYLLIILAQYGMKRRTRIYKHELFQIICATNFHYHGIWQLAHKRRFY